MFESGSAYLPTKKVGKNNPKEEEIVADNKLRQEWNYTVDSALIAGVPDETILAFKREKIIEPIHDSISKNGSRPELLASILRLAIDSLKQMRQQLKSPRKPVLKVDLEEYEAMQNLVQLLKEMQAKSDKLEKRINQKSQFISVCRKTSKRNEELAALRKLFNRFYYLRMECAKLVSDNAYRSVEALMKAYNKSYTLVEQYNRDKAKYDEAVAAGLITEAGDNPNPSSEK